MTALNLCKFIEEKYDVRRKIEELKRDPYDEFLKSDIFPCDFVCIVDGQLTKMLYYNDEQDEISVRDLLSCTREELEKSSSPGLLKLYDAYVQNFTFEKVDVEDLLKIDELRSQLIKDKVQNS